MRFTLPNNSSRLRAGFTLIEVLIIAPIVVLAIGGFVALMMAMVGDVLLTRDQNVLAYEMQDALDRIEQDTRIGTQFLNTSRTLTAPQGSGDTTTAFTAPNALIMGSLATDKNPSDPMRQLIYYANQPAACGATQGQNLVFINKVIYYIKNSSLWRRVIVPPYNTTTPANGLTLCSAPWQQNTCSPGYTLSPPCQTNDAEVMKNIETFTVKYYDTPSATTELTGTNILNASTIDVAITGKKTTVGKTASSSGSIRASKLNTLNADVPPPATPSVSHFISESPSPSVNFTWPSVQYAASYKVKYQINGGTEVAVTLNGATTAYTVNAFRTDIVTFKVAAENLSGLSPDASDAATIPPWSNIELQSGWLNDTGIYSRAQYTKSPDGRVFIKGFIRSGIATSGTIVGTLPAGYRPSGRLAFPTAASTINIGRVDIDQNGNIILMAGNSDWVSLDGLSFLPSTSTYTWNTMPFQNGWTNWGTTTPSVTYEDVRVAKDSIGRIHLQGTAKAGTTAAGNNMAQTDAISTTYRPAQTIYFPAGADTGVFDGYSIGSPAGQLVTRGVQTSSLMGMQTMYYPGALGTWTPLTLQGTWTAHDLAFFPTLQYTKASDKVVTLRGMIKGGSMSANTVIANIPDGARPTSRQVFTVTSSDALARIEVDPGGNIIVQLVNSGWVGINLSYIVN